jgi:hypothetical protein
MAVKPGTGVKPGGATAPAAAHTHKKFSITNDIDKRGKKVVLYAPGGWGKTSIAAMAPGAVILDIERRTGHVAEKLAAHNYPLNRIKNLGDVENASDPANSIDPAQGFADVRHALHNFDLFPSGSTVVIDSATKLEEWSWAWVLANIKTDKGAEVHEIEGYGYGKGYTHGYEQMCKVLQDCDVLANRGVNIILICHDCIANFDDPVQVGEHKRYEPRLYRSGSGNTDTRLRVREWSDAVLFGTYEMTRDKSGRVTGQGTRAIYTQERPGFMAKSSLAREHFLVPVNHEFDGTIWRLAIGDAS